MVVTLPEQTLVELYKEGKSLRELARTFKCAEQTIRHKLRKLGALEEKHMFKRSCLQCNQPFHTFSAQEKLCSKECTKKRQAKRGSVYMKFALANKPEYARAQGFHREIGFLQRKLLKKPLDPVLLRRLDVMLQLKNDLIKIGGEGELKENENKS